MSCESDWERTASLQNVADPLPAVLTMIGWAWLFWHTGAARKWGLLEILLGVLAFLVWTKTMKQWPFEKGQPTVQRLSLFERRSRRLKQTNRVREEAFENSPRNLFIQRHVFDGLWFNSRADSSCQDGAALPETIEAIDSARDTRFCILRRTRTMEKWRVLTYLARGLHADGGCFH